MKFGVIIFPGSNCDHDAYWTIKNVARQPVTFLWHESHDLQNCDAIIVPGGFAFGDYLRTGAIAKFSPVMESVRKFADGGGLVLGICNGFQILCESGLAPRRADAQPGAEICVQTGAQVRGGKSRTLQFTQRLPRRRSADYPHRAPWKVTISAIKQLSLT